MGNGCAARNAVFRSIYLSNIPWRKKIRTLACRPDIRSYKRVCKNCANCVASEPSNTTYLPYKGVERIAMQLVFQHDSKMRVKATTPDSSVSLLKPARLTQSNFHHQVALRIIDMSKDHTFWLLKSNFSEMIKLLLKRMVVPYAVAAPVVMVVSPYKKTSRSPQEDSKLVCPTLTKSTV